MLPAHPTNPVLYQYLDLILSIKDFTASKRKLSLSFLFMLFELSIEKIISTGDCIFSIFS